MGVYFLGPQLLIRSGLVAMAEACCCQDEPCDCCEPGTGGATMTIRLAGFPNTNAFGYCNLNLSALNGDWELPFYDLDGGSCRYLLEDFVSFSCPSCPGPELLRMYLSMTCQENQIQWSLTITAYLSCAGGLGGEFQIAWKTWTTTPTTPINCTTYQTSASPLSGPGPGVSGNLAGTSITINP